MKNNNSKKVVAFLLKRFDCNDGVASHCETLIRGLIDSGWRVVLITGPVSFDDGTADRIKRLQSMVEGWVVLDGLNTVLPSLSCLATINQTIQKFQPALLHAHGYTPLVAARVFSLLKKLRCVATFHPSIHGNDPKTLAKEAANLQARKYKMYLSLFSPSRFIACSSESVALLEETLGINSSRVRKILLGIDTRYFRPPDASERAAARKRMNFEDDVLVCALVGRLSWNKGHDVLIDAIRQVKRETQSRNLVGLFAGMGEQSKEIKNYAADDRTFLFSGYVEDLRDIYWASDIFVLPSRSEGFALVVAEAMCCGLLPIRTPSGGAVDQIEHGKNGFIIPFDDSQNLAAHLKKILSDSNFRKSVSLRALDSAREKFALDKMVEDTISVYQEIALDS